MLAGLARLFPAHGRVQVAVTGAMTVAAAEDTTVEGVSAGSDVTVIVRVQSVAGAAVTASPSSMSACVNTMSTQPFSSSQYAKTKNKNILQQLS